jgi:hypothetical protein
MTLRCASCGRALRAYALVIRSSDARRWGYGPKCARSAALQALASGMADISAIGLDEMERIRSLVRANAWDGTRIRKQAAPIIRNYASRDNVTQDGQLALEFA